MVVHATSTASGFGEPNRSILMDEVPDREKRNVMNLLLVGALGLPGTAMLGSFANFFVPQGCAPVAPAVSPHT